MPNTKEAAILSAVAEAVTWKNEALEVEGPRKGQRVVIYPKELTQLDAVLRAGDPNIDSENGHPIAYQQVLSESQKYENPPLFLREDSEQITSDPKMAESGPKWMCIAERVATGNRRRVLEDGNDAWHSDDEAKEEVIPDEEHGMYTKEMDPSKGPVHLTRAQVAAQKAAAQAQAPKEPKVPPRSQSPLSGSSDDDLSRPEWIWSQTKGIFRRNKARVKRIAESALALPAPEPEPKRQPTPMTTPVNSDNEGMSENQRRKAGTAKKMVTRGSKKPVPESQASKPRKGQESPETKVSTPMVTRRQETSRAGGLRSGGGSGQTGTRVAKGNPPKT
jgi:hypothetical protein